VPSKLELLSSVPFYSVSPALHSGSYAVATHNSHLSFNPNNPRMSHCTQLVCTKMKDVREGDTLDRLLYPSLHFEGAIVAKQSHL
jgi:hypothetical protein